MKKIGILLTAIIMVLMLAGCQKTSQDATLKSEHLLGEPTLTVGEKTYNYLKYDGNEDDCVNHLTITIDDLDTTVDQLIESNDKYNFYSVKGASGYEVVVLEYTDSGEQSVRLVNQADFDNIGELMEYFGILSPDDIDHCEIYKLTVENDSEGVYVFDKTDDSDETKENVFEIMSQMGGSGGTTRYFIKGGEVESGSVDKYKSWAEGVKKVDVVLKTGVRIPIAYSESDKFMSILSDNNTYGNFITSVTAKIGEMMAEIE